MINLDVTDKLVTLSLSPGDVDAATLSVDYLVGYLNDSGVFYGILNGAISDVVRQVSELVRSDRIVCRGRHRGVLSCRSTVISWVGGRVTARAVTLNTRVTNGN